MVARKGNQRTSGRCMGDCALLRVLARLDVQIVRRHARINPRATGKLLRIDQGIRMEVRGARSWTTSVHKPVQLVLLHPSGSTGGPARSEVCGLAQRSADQTGERRGAGGFTGPTVRKQYADANGHPDGRPTRWRTRPPPSMWSGSRGPGALRPPWPRASRRRRGQRRGRSNRAALIPVPARILAAWRNQSFAAALRRRIASGSQA